MSLPPCRLFGFLAVTFLLLGCSGLLLGRSVDSFCTTWQELAEREDNDTQKRSYCLDKLRKEKKKSPEVVSCKLDCLGNSTEDFRALYKCSDDCEKYDGKPFVKTVVRVSASGTTAVVTIDSEPYAELEVGLKDYRQGKKREKAQNVTADGNGRAEVTFTELKGGTYFADAGAKKGGLEGQGQAEFRIKRPVLDFNPEKQQPGEEIRWCYAKLYAARMSEIPGDNVSPRIPFDAAGKAEVTVEMNGAESLTFHGKKYTFTEQKVRLPIDLSQFPTPHLAEKILTSPRVETEMAVTHPKLGTFKGTFSCVMGKAGPYERGKPFTFTGDREAPSGKQVAVLFETVKRKTQIDRVIGSADALAADVDYFAESDPEFEKSGTCPYVGASSGIGREITKTRVHETITLYDRRTGAVVATKRFQARSPSCPNTISKENASYDVYGKVSPSSIDQWVRQEMARR